MSESSKLVVYPAGSSDKYQVSDGVYASWSIDLRSDFSKKNRVGKSVVQSGLTKFRNN
jgi:hypothetical protein